MAAAGPRRDRESLVAVPAERRGPFGTAPFEIANRLAKHPLFEAERIKKLLRALPRERVEIREVSVSDAHDGSYQRAIVQGGEHHALHALA